MLVDRLRRVYEEIAKVELVAGRFPDDIYVRANLTSLRHDAEELEIEWSQQTRVEQKEVCRYRMIPSLSNAYSIRSITRSLLDFQDLFSQIYDAMRHGAKKRARLSIDVLQQTTLSLAFTYPGSLGVAMSIQSAPDLLVGKFDDAIDAVMQLVDARNEYDVRDMAKSLGEAVIKRAYDWAYVNADACYAVDLDWTKLNGSHKGGMIDADSFARLVGIIGRTSNLETKQIKVRGVLVGFDSKSKRFRLVDPEGEDYSGALSDAFPSGAVWHVNEAYTADIEVEEIQEYATETTRRVNRLKHLEP